MATLIDPYRFASAPAALTPTILTSGTDDTDTTGGFTTASVALTAGRLYTLAFVTRAVGTGSQGSLTATQTGATWTQVNTSGYDSNNTRLTVFRCQPASNVSAATITVENPDPITSDWGQWMVVEWTGVFNDSANNGAGAIVQSGTSSGTNNSPSVTLAALASALNINMLFAAHKNTSSFVGRSPATTLGTTTIGVVWLGAAYRINATQVVLDASASAPTCAVAIEVKSA